VTDSPDNCAERRMTAKEERDHWRRVRELDEAAMDAIGGDDDGPEPGLRLTAIVAAAAMAGVALLTWAVLS
jgi:hypothetical protein